MLLVAEKSSEASILRQLRWQLGVETEKFGAFWQQPTLLMMMIQADSLEPVKAFYDGSQCHVISHQLQMHNMQLSLS